VPSAAPTDETAATGTADVSPKQISRITTFDHPLAMQQSLSDRGIAARAALKAGVLGIFIGIIPVLGIVLTGSLAVYFYRREKGSVPSTRIGSRVGAAAGVVSFAINSLVILIRILALHGQQEYIDAVTKFLQMAGYNPADPKMHADIQSLFTPPGMVLTFFFGMIFVIALAALGGALGAMIFRSISRRG